MTDDEEWRPIAVWPGHEVSNHGRVRSVDHYVMNGAGTAVNALRRGRILRQRPARSGGYLTVGGRPGGRATTLYVHALVLEAFVGSRPEGLECCHGDGDPANNHVSNLRWDTPSANAADRLKHGRSGKGGPRKGAREGECRRGHRRAEPNLCGYRSRKGLFSCLACARGRDEMRRDIKAGRQPRSWQEASDCAYAKIMGDPTT